MSAADTFAVSFFSSIEDEHPAAASVTWDAICEMVSDPTPVGSEDVARLWSPARYPSTATSTDDHVIALSLLVLEFTNVHWRDVLPAWRGVSMCVHTLWGHTASQPRWRLIVRLADPVKGDDWVAFWHWANARSGGHADARNMDQGARYLVPVFPAGRPAAYIHRVISGVPLRLPSDPLGNDTTQVNLKIPILETAEAPLPRGPDPFGGQWQSVQQRMGAMDWLSAEPSERPWLLERVIDGEKGRSVGFLPRGKVGLVASCGGAGKTQALVQLALSVALPSTAHERDPQRFGWFARKTPDGRDWRSPFQVAQGGRVLYLLGDEDEDEIRRRLWRAAKAYGLAGVLGKKSVPPASTYSRGDLDRWRMKALDRLYIVPGANRKLTLTGADGLLQSVLERLNDAGSEWALIVLDPLSRFGNGDPRHDHEAANELIQAAEQLCRVRGNPAVLLAQENPPQPGGASSLSACAAGGATAITNGIRWQANLAPRVGRTAPHRLIQFGLGKSNFTAPVPPIDLVWCEGQTLAMAHPDEVDAWRQGADVSGKHRLLDERSMHSLGGDTGSWPG